MVRRDFFQGLALAGTLILAGVPAAQAQADKHRVVVQVSDDNPKTWTQALNVVRNVQSAYGKDKVDVELVVFGLGSGLLKFDSPLSNRIDETLASGASVYMCENTLKGQKLTKADMHSKISYVTAGVIEIIEKQKQGWAVIRP
jgi:intracellular sulfur oxidation DsrE/DsrF family protein